MDVSYKKKSVLVVIIALSFLLTACGVPKDESAVFISSDDCSTQTSNNRFIVKWKNGKISVIKNKTKSELKKSFVKNNLEKIDYIVNDQIIYHKSPNIVEVSPQTTTVNWGIDNINASAAWSQDLRGQNITVAVHDTGVDTSHPQLSSQIALNNGEIGLDANGLDKRFNGVDDDDNGYVDDFEGFDFLFDQALKGPLDQHGDNHFHGTHISGIIAASHNDTSSTTNYTQGVAPGAKILPVAFMDTDYGFLSDAIKGIDYAVQRGAQIINASWGGAICASPIFSDRLRKLETENVLMVFASGNEGVNLDVHPVFPASYGLATQIIVGSVSSSNFQSAFSNYGLKTVHLLAPGDQIYSTMPNEEDRFLEGTSMAAPYVSGAAALLMSHRPEATPSQIRQALFNSVKTNDYATITRGRLDIAKALQEIEQLAP